MKVMKTRLTVLFLAFASILAFVSCDENWWNNYGDSDVDGQWRIVEASYGSNYVQGDIWTFQSNGYFTATGQDLYEEGTWQRRQRTLLIAINSPQVNVEAYVSNYDGDYMVLDVNDYDYGRYTLRLVRENYYGYNKPAQPTEKRNNRSAR